MLTKKVYFHWNPYYGSSSVVIYYQKLALLLIWIAFYTIFTAAHFLMSFLAMFFLGFFLLFLMSTAEKPLKDKSPEMFFISLLYCLIPSYTSVWISCCAVFIMLAGIHFLFKNWEGYFIHPVLITLSILLSLFYDNGFSTQIDFSCNSFIKNFGFLTAQVNTHFEMTNILFFLFGGNMLNPSQMGGVLILVSFFFWKKERIFLFLNSFAYLLFTFFFILIIGNIIYFCLDHKMAFFYLEKQYRALGNVSLFFYACFVIPESLGGAFHLRAKKKVMILSSFLTASFICLGIQNIAALLGILLGNLFIPWFSYKEHLIGKNKICKN